MELAMESAIAGPCPAPLPVNETEQSNIPLIFGTFFLSGDEFAIEMTDLQEIAPPPARLQKMPLSPKFLRGLFNLRGRILPVIDLRLALEMQPVAIEEDDIPCMAVLSRGPAVIGILFDAVGEILRLRPSDIVPVGTRNRSDETRHSPVKSILSQNHGERLIQILDLETLFAIRNLPALERRSPARLADKNFVTQRMKDLRREKLIGFTVAGFNLAFEMKCVLAILDGSGRKPSPRKSALCESIVTHGKRMVPVVSLANLLELTPDQPACRIVVCQVGESQVGFEVNEVTAIMPFSNDKVLPVPILVEHRAAVVRGCFTHSDGNEFIVLNHEGTLAHPEVVEVSVGHHQISNERRLIEAQTLVPRIALLSFRMGKLYGIPLLDVVEVMVAPRSLIRTPAMPPAVLGVLSLRGEAISVVDPRHLLHLAPAPAESESRSLLIFRHHGRKVAMLVDSIETILSVPAGTDLELPEIFFREEQTRLMDSFERGLHIETDGEKTVVLILSAERIVTLLVAALEA